MQNEKGEVTAIEMSFECLDDFQDPPGGMFHRYCQAMCGEGGGNDQAGFTELTTLPQTSSSNKSQPVEFNKDNHVLQWMVCRYKHTIAAFMCYCLGKVQTYHFASTSGYQRATLLQMESICHAWFYHQPEYLFTLSSYSDIICSCVAITK